MKKIWSNNVLAIIIVVLMLLISVGSAITIKFGEDSNNIGWIGIDRLVENSNNLQSAINSLDNTTGTVQLGNDITLSSGVILWENVTFDMNGYTITPNSDFDIIQMKPGSTLCNGMINTVALGENGFNSSAILLDGSDDFGAEDIGTGNAVYYRTQIYNIGLYGWQDHGGTGLKNGTGIRFRSNNSGEFISFVNVHDIYFDGWSKSIYLECRGAAAAPYSYINGNMFSNIVMEDPHYGIHLYCENTTGNNIHANHFSNIQMQAGGWTKYGIRCDGDMNIFDNIEVWDINSVGDSGRYAVSFSSGSSENICSGNNEGGNISNTGTDNMFINRQNHTINYDGWTLENPYLNNAVLNYLQTTTTMVFNNSVGQMIQFTLADDDSKIYGGDGNTDDLYIYGGNTGLPYLYLDGDAYVDINVDGGDYFRILENSNEVLRFQDTGPDSMIEAVTASQNINLTSGAGGKIEIYNVLHITPQPTAPAGAISGDMYFDSTNNTLCVYGDGGWVGLW